MLQAAIRTLHTTPAYTADHRRAWSLFRQLRDHDTVDLAQSPLFWQLARQVMAKRHWLRAALWFTVVP
jgi:hypothetical protein